MTEIPTPLMTVRFGAATDRGLRRPINEDSYLAAEPLFLIADGMGGHEGGELASRAVIDAFAPLVGRLSVDADIVNIAYRAAVESVFAIPGLHGSAAGTTLTGVAIAENGGEAYWLMINVGDSRTYRLAGGVLEQISVDHSVVQELVESGRLTASEASTDPRRNVVTRAIGAGTLSEPDYWLIPAARGDRILVCSDGLSGEVDKPLIERLLLTEIEPQAAATRLVHEALLHGGRDNVTVVVVDAIDVAGSDDGATRPSDGARDVAVDADRDNLDDTIPRRPAVESGDGR
ncbi:MAG TPA: protein phosphatase 2C domain-containing protein [Microbacteriaceae bacterium]